MFREHNHTHGRACGRSNEKVILAGFALTAGFMVVEAVGGWLSGSLALIADAGHMLTDSVALALAWAGFRFGRKPADHSKTFGYFRFEVLAALANAVFLFILTVLIGCEAFVRLRHPVEVMALPMLAVAVLGLAVNGMVFYILARGDKEHLNVKSAILHVLGDLLGSLGAVTAAVIIWLAGWTAADPILSLLVCLLILRSAWGVLKNAFNILMEGTPPDIDLEIIENSIAGVPNVEEVGHIHIWSITSNKAMITMNVSVFNEKEAMDTVRRIKKKLEHEFGIHHSTIEVGPVGCPLQIS